jgi:hypothetical protein
MEKVNGIGGLFFPPAMPKGSRAGIKSTWVSPEAHPAMKSSCGIRRPGQLRSLRSLRTRSILVTRPKSG